MTVLCRFRYDNVLDVLALHNLEILLRCKLAIIVREKTLEHDKHFQNV